MEFSGKHTELMAHLSEEKGQKMSQTSLFTTPLSEGILHIPEPEHCDYLDNKLNQIFTMERKSLHVNIEESILDYERTHDPSCRRWGVNWKFDPAYVDGIYWCGQCAPGVCVCSTNITIKQATCLSFSYSYPFYFIGLYNEPMMHTMYESEHLREECIIGQLWNRSTFTEHLSSHVTIKGISIIIVPEAIPYLAAHILCTPCELIDALTHISPMQFYELSDLFHSIDRARPHPTRAKTFYQAKVIEVLMTVVDYFLSSRKEELVTPIRHSDELLVHQALMIIDSSLSARLTTSHLAHALHTHESTLINSFKRLLGMTPQTLIRKKRLEKARSMLKNNPASTISHIAQSVGYTNPGSFSEAFQRMFGIGPQEYRKRCSSTAGKILRQKIQLSYEE